MMYLSQESSRMPNAEFTLMVRGPATLYAFGQRGVHSSVFFLVRGADMKPVIEVKNDWHYTRVYGLICISNPTDSRRCPRRSLRVHTRRDGR